MSAIMTNEEFQTRRAIRDGASVSLPGRAFSALRAVFQDEEKAQALLRTNYAQRLTRLQEEIRSELGPAAEFELLSAAMEMARLNVKDGAS